MKAKVIIDLPNKFIEQIKQYACVTTAEELKGFLKASWLQDIEKLRNDYGDITVSVEVEE